MGGSDRLTERGFKAQWYHLQHQIIGTESHVACLCPHDADSACAHERYIKDNREQFWEAELHLDGAGTW